MFNNLFSKVVPFVR